MKPALSILKQYWNHHSFRPVQEEVIDAVLNRHDVLALMPTGGGKSICFQIPALVNKGICIVITPLIALMKDQVGQLANKGIKAVAIYSGMSRKEIDINLDNCIYGDVKFLYVSPERIHTEIFKARVIKMNVNLIAVDEAHCISQWGYDFRPAYLHIATLRDLFPQINIIALTATATSDVVVDIQNKLKFNNGKVLHKSFARDNLSYSVRYTEDKYKLLLGILNNVPGPSIVYAGTRKATREITRFLIEQGVSADFYNAGLSHEERVKRQDNWFKSYRRVMVSTNAFGMGIDKPDVRTVIHLDLPQNLESYYQEAGRAGRDGMKAYAVIIYNNLDLASLKRKVEQQHPSPEFLVKVYQSLANFYQIAIGSAEGQSFDFDIQQFSDTYNLHGLEVFYALKKLEQEDLIQFNESFHNPSQIHIALDNQELYKFQIANAGYDAMIKALLRLYGGELFNNFIRISEKQIAEYFESDEREVRQGLQMLDEIGVVDYDQKKESPQVVFVVPRRDVNALGLDKKNLAIRKDTATKKLDAMEHYVLHKARCRAQLLLEYFGEVTYDQCGKCDICIAEKKKISIHDIESMNKTVHKIVSQKPVTVEELIDKMNPGDSDVLFELVREMIDRGELHYDNHWRLSVI